MMSARRTTRRIRPWRWTCAPWTTSDPRRLLDGGDPNLAVACFPAAVIDIVARGLDSHLRHGPDPAHRCLREQVRAPAHAGDTPLPA